MDNLITAGKALAMILAMVLVFVGGPTWGATGSLERAWEAVKEFCLIMGAFVLVGGGAGLIAALIERL